MKCIKAQGKYSFLSLVALLALTGCASVNVYDKDGTTNSGIRFYTAKPYVMVTRNGTKEKPVDVQIVHLPDLENPQYAKVRFGIGNADMNLAVANGSLSTFGGKGDSQADEMLTAFTSGFKAIEEGLLTRRTDPNVEDEQATKTQTDGVRIDLEDLIEKMPGDIGQLGDLGSTDDSIRSAFSSLTPKLKAAIEILGGASLEAVERRMPGVVEILNESKRVFAASVSEGGMTITENSTDPVQNYMTALTRHSATIDSALAVLVEKPVAPPVVELYEVVFNGGATSLRRIALPN